MIDQRSEKNGRFNQNGCIQAVTCLSPEEGTSAVSQIKAVSSILRTAVVWLGLVVFSTCLACPFCLAPSQTWSEMFAEADVVVWCRLISSEEGSDQKQPSSRVEVLKVARGKGVVKVKQIIDLAQPIFAEPGSSVLLKGSFHDIAIAGMSDTFATDSDGREIDQASLKQSASVPTPTIIPASAVSNQQASDGTKGKTLVWDFAEPVSAQAFQYITSAPVLGEPAADRLRFFVRYLEHSDDLIAADAWGEFANASYEDIVSIREHLPADKLKKWIVSAELTPERPGLYGMLLGLCGRQQDIPFLMEQIGTGVRDDVRFGTEGLMGGLLVLSKEDGLKFLIDSRLANPDAATSEVFNAMSAVKYVWDYEPDLFKKDQLRASLRPLLDREEFQEIIITDLARWEDWTIMEQLEELAKSTDQGGVIRSTIGYCWQVQKTGSATDEQKREAAGLLALVKKSHPDVYRRQLMFR